MARGQFPAPTGSRVRIHAPKSGFESIVGRVVSQDSSRMMIRVSGQPQPYVVHRGEIVTLDVSLHRQRHPLGGALIGFIQGSTLGLGWSSIGNSEVPKEGVTHRGGVRALYLGAVGGALVGTGLGYLFRTDDWSEVIKYVPPAR